MKTVTHVGAQTFHLTMCELPQRHIMADRTVVVLMRQNGTFIPTWGHQGGTDTFQNAKRFKTKKEAEEYRDVFGDPRTEKGIRDTVAVKVTTHTQLTFEI